MSMKFDPNIEALLEGITSAKKMQKDAVLCRVCGQQFADFARHLQEAHHMTMARYRSLGPDYSLLPPSYSARKIAYLTAASRRGLNVAR